RRLLLLDALPRPRGGAPLRRLARARPAACSSSPTGCRSRPHTRCRATPSTGSSGVRRRSSATGATGTASIDSTASSRRRVQSLVDEPVGELVVLPANGRVRHLPDLAREPRRLERQFAQRGVLHLVLAVHLLDEQLGIGHDLDLRDRELDRLLEPRHEPAVLGDVVRRHADPLAVRGEHRAVLRLEHVAECRRTGVPARASVRRELRLHESGYRSNASSSYGWASRSAATTASTSSAGTTVSTRSSATRSSWPARPTDGDVPGAPRNVPVPSVYQEQCVYSPITPAPAAKTASLVASSASRGTNHTSLCVCAVTFVCSGRRKRQQHGNDHR